MINLEEEKLKELQDYASLFLTIEEIAILLDIKKNELTEAIKDKSTEISKRYHKGKLLSKIELRKNTIKMAKHGSPLAEELCNKYMRQQDNSES